MSKFVVAIVSGALAWVVGFLLGALFTVPQNKEMEELVNAKAEMTRQVQILQTEKEKLVKNGAQLKKQALELKDKLLRAYEVEKETEIF